MSKVVRADVAIVGAGIMGSCLAYSLASRGVSCILLEQFDFLHSRGSSHGHSRIIRRTYPEPHYTKMMGHAYALWGQAETEAGFKVITRTGGLDVARSDDSEIHDLIAACKELGVEHEVLSPAQVLQRFPQVSLPENYVGVFSPEAGVVNATGAVSMFQMLARNRGAILRSRSEVSNIVIDKDSGASTHTVKVQLSDDFTVQCKRAAITAGPWSKKSVAEWFGVNLPITVVKISVPYWRCTDQETYNYRTGKSGTSGFPVFIHYGKPDIYGLPALEYPSLFKLCLHTGPVLQEAAHDHEPDWASIESELKPHLCASTSSSSSSSSSGDESPGSSAGAGAGFQMLGLDGTAPALCETCLYSNTPDHDFIIDRLQPGDPRVVLGAGFSGHGFKLAPVVGELLADLLALNVVDANADAQKDPLAEKMGIDLATFSLLRFSRSSL